MTNSTTLLLFLFCNLPPKALKLNEKVHDYHLRVHHFALLAPFLIVIFFFGGFLIAILF